MYNRFRELPHNYISFQKIDRKGRRYAYQKKPVNMVYSYINEQNKKAVEGAAVLHLPQQREIFSFLPILEESDALIVGALIFTMIGIGKSTPTIKLYSSPRSSQNGIIKILILAKCLLYLLFDKRA